ncbi:hypothetical protein B9479_004440 [Cryptococcus floricola]|uniref:Uncharacterized protein n=1 Tax=Cryptococcus floricola TaxID=2591691 RepID=A0A5D3AX49_9TREE|nr:hypothetical protein B9479_004440 [Cryptococcus floricola]
MPSFSSSPAPAPGASFLSDFRPPKSPKRFFTLGSSASSSHPPLPMSTSTVGHSRTPSDLGFGVTVVKTPRDAAASSMKQAAGLITPPSKPPPLPPMPSLNSLPTLPSQARYPQPSSKNHPHSTHAYGHQSSRSVDNSYTFTAKLERSAVPERSTSTRADLRVGLEPRLGRGLAKSPSAAPVLGERIKDREEAKDTVGPMPTTPNRRSAKSPFLSPGNMTVHTHARSNSHASFLNSPPVSYHSRSSSVGGRSQRSSAMTSGSGSGRESSSSSIPPSPILKRPSMSHRTTIKPPPRTSSKPDTPFHATLLSLTRKPLPRLPTGEQESVTLVNIEFAYSLSDPAKNENVTLPLEVLRNGGGFLGEWVQGCLIVQEEEERKAREKEREQREEKEVLMKERERKMPAMTDGESAEESDLDSDYELNLLREEYLKSIYVAPSPDSSFSTLPPFPSPPLRFNPITPPSSHLPLPKSPKPSGYKRAQTRNQYTQLINKPRTPGSSNEPVVPPLAYEISMIGEKGSTPPLNIRRKAPRLSLQPRAEVEKKEKGMFTEMRVFLIREAGAYHQITHRLLSGDWPELTPSLKARTEKELLWLGMKKLVEELKRPLLGPLLSEGKGSGLGLDIDLRDVRPFGTRGEEQGRQVRSERSERPEEREREREERKSGTPSGKWRERAREKSLVLRGGYI